ncbi:MULTISPECIES: hypothetical protein [Helcococcus]|uniref:Phage protein n=1 Tax=Helcococcus bovis TaxID=3153252 RepID=A0ABW9F751_9FIRM
MINLFSEMLTKHLLATIITSIFAAMGWILKKVASEYVKTQKFKREQLESEKKLNEDRRIKEELEQDLLKQGMLALLRFRVNKIIDSIYEKGKMTLNEKLDLDDLYQAYESLGGNSRTHQKYMDCMERFQIDYSESK